MSQILLVTTSARGDRSTSRSFAERLIAAWQVLEPDLDIVLRDLAANPPPHMDADLLNGLRLSPALRSASQRSAIARSDVLIEEIKNAETLVIAAPVYNLSIPSTLKAWLDHIVRAGQTFRYTQQRSDGLLRGKRAVIVSSRGGTQSQGRDSSAEFQEPYLRAIFNFIGITDLEFLHVEDQNLEPIQVERGYATAYAAIARAVF